MSLCPQRLTQTTGATLFQRKAALSANTEQLRLRKYVTSSFLPSSVA